MAKPTSLRLTLLRHGLAADKEAWSKQRKPDLERPLTPKGARRVGQAARGLRVLGLAPERVLTSPAVRALQTAKLAVEELGLSGRVLQEEPALAPEAAPEDFLAALESIDAREVLCVGHAPHLDEVLAALLGLRNGKGGLALKKSGAAVLRVRAGQPGPAELRALLSPWALRRLGRR